MGENPWDLGLYGNWKSVMGDNPIDWLLPFNESPCAKHEDEESFYELGPLYQQLRARFGLPEVPPQRRAETGEMTEQGVRNQHGAGTQ
jgi:palmitoyltransferase